MKKKVVLELVGLDGNAFALMGAFKRAGLRQGCDRDEIEAVLKDAMSGDYNHLLRVLADNTISEE